MNLKLRCRAYCQAAYMGSQESYPQLLQLPHTLHVSSVMEGPMLRKNGCRDRSLDTSGILVAFNVDFFTARRHGWQSMNAKDRCGGHGGASLSMYLGRARDDPLRWRFELSERVFVGRVVRMQGVDAG